MGSQKESEAVAGLLRRSLAHDTNVDSACLEPEILAAYFERTLRADEAKGCDLHLSHCARCREQLAAMVRAEASANMHGREASPRLAWLFDWRWLTAAAAVMVLVTVWLLGKPPRLVPKTPQSAPLIAANKVEPAKPSSPGAEFDANALSARSGSREVVPTNRIATRGKSPSVPSKKSVPSAQKTDDLAAVAPSRTERESQSQLADSSIAANEASGAAMEARDSKQSSRAAQQARLASAGHSFAAQQTQATQRVGVQTEAQQVSRSSPQSSHERAAAQASVQAGTGGGVGNESGGPQMKAQAKAGPPPSVAPVGGAPGSGAIGGVAGAEASLDREAAAKEKQGMASDANARLRKDSGAALQVLEERSAEKVIDTPDPTVKWRIAALGFVERSEDGGATWKGQEVDATAALLAGSAPDGKTCWVVGRNGLVLVTKDGRTWKKIPPPASRDIVAVSAEDASSATVTTADGQRFSTHNSGKKWKLETKPGDSNPR